MFHVKRYLEHFTARRSPAVTTIVREEWHIDLVSSSRLKSNQAQRGACTGRTCGGNHACPDALQRRIRIEPTFDSAELAAAGAVDPLISFISPGP